MRCGAVRSVRNVRGMSGMWDVEVARLARTGAEPFAFKQSRCLQKQLGRVMYK